MRESRHSVKFNKSVKVSQISRSFVKFNLIIVRKKVNKRRNSIIIKFFREFVNSWREIPVSDSNPINFYCVIDEAIFVLFLLFD